ncbi:hypothetical protein EDB84DRAFT_1515846 [Lactarius hengduanensis]|nr:hypothetical protein EDB84DRAFT_1515846 [Lactarius hengduanensis]
MRFEKEFVSVIVDPHLERDGPHPFIMQVKCQQLDWQAACAAQICDALEPLLRGVDSLTFGFHRDSPALWLDEVDHALWHGLLRTFDGVKNLQLTGGVVRDLFRHLQRGEGELPSVLLLGLREPVPSAFQTLPLPPPIITAYCDRCDQWFPHDRALEQHKEDSDSHWACDDCDLDFGSHDALRQHYSQSQNHNYCKESVFKSEPGLHSHYKDKSDHHYCFECEGDFHDEDELWGHLVEYHNACGDCHEHDHGVHIYCTECDRSFQSESNLWHHLNSKLHQPTLTQHFESGACRSGVTRELFNRLIARADRNNHITNPRGWSVGRHAMTSRR